MIVLPMDRYYYAPTYDPFPGGHYVHPFLTWEDSDNEGKEHPRTVRVPPATPRLRDLTGKPRWC